MTRPRKYKILLTDDEFKVSVKLTAYRIPYLELILS